MSALRSNSPAPSPAWPPATPMLAWTSSSCPSATTGAAKAARIRSAMSTPAPGVCALEQDGELVAAQPGGGVARADAAAEALGHAGQEGVPDHVAERVVDGLEVVEVDQHDHQPARADRGQRAPDPLAEQRPVGELGQL